MKEGRAPLRTFGDLAQFVSLQDDEPAPAPASSDETASATPPHDGAEKADGITKTEGDAVSQAAGESPAADPPAGDNAPTNAAE